MRLAFSGGRLPSPLWLRLFESGALYESLVMDSDGGGGWVSRAALSFESEASRVVAKLSGGSSALHVDDVSDWAEVPFQPIEPNGLGGFNSVVSLAEVCVGGGGWPCHPVRHRSS